MPGVACVQRCGYLMYAGRARRGARGGQWPTVSVGMGAVER